MIDSKREEIQLACVDSWLKNNQRGTFELPTGVGKTFIAYHCISKLPKGSSVLLLAETTLREKTFLDDAVEYKKYYGTDIFKEYNIEFMCYQGAYKLKDRNWDIVIADEIHDLCTPTRMLFVKNNKFGSIVGLSATIDGKVEYINETETINKLQYLNSFCPIIFTYTIGQAQDEKTMRKFQIYAIRHELDTINKTVHVEYKDKGEAKSFSQTEYAAYTYMNKRFRESIFMKNEFLIMTLAGKRAKLLYTLPSKTGATKKLLQYLGRTVVFGNDIPTLETIAPCVSSKRTDKQNAKLLEEFQTGEVNVISSFKVLKQGYNLKDLDNVIIHGYYGKSKDLIQMIGRSLRTMDGSSKIFIFVTQGTQEERWFSKMFEGNPLSIIWCNNIEDVVNKFKS